MASQVAVHASDIEEELESLIIELGGMSNVRFDVSLSRVVQSCRSRASIVHDLIGSENRRCASNVITKTARDKSELDRIDAQSQGIMLSNSTDDTLRLSPKNEIVPKSSQLLPAWSTIESYTPYTQEHRSR